jgi:stage II sporulation protein M
MPHALKRRFAVGIATLWRAWPCIALGAVLFTAGAGIGVAAGSVRHPWLLAALRTLDVSSISSPTYPRRALALWTHNTLANYAFFWLGRFGGLLPAIGLLANGALLGGLLAVVLATHRVGEVLPLLAPHGVFELPAMIVAPSLGIWVGASSWRRGRSTALRRRRRRGNLVFVLLVMPALAIAALIEALSAP